MPNPGDQHQASAATANPFLEPKQHISAYTALEIITLQSRLNKQLGPEYISTRQGPGGGRVHYLAGEKAINLANEIFGFNGWTSTVQKLEVDFVDENARNGDITLGLSSTVRVTLRDGTFHEDIGYGSIKGCKGKAAAFEKAKKEAVTDGLKRALRNFGNVLGNCLYDKDYLSRISKMKVAPVKWNEENLHRHPDFAPIKPESIAEVEAQKEKDAASRRQASAQTNSSFTSVEFDDDFGHIEEVYFDHPDQVRLDETPAKHSASRRNDGVTPGQHMPHLRQQNPQPPSPAPNLQQPPRPPGPPGAPPAPNPSAAAQPSRMQPPPPVTKPQMPGTSAAPATRASADGQGARATATAAAESASSNLQTGQDQPRDENGFPQPRVPPPGIPDGFVTGRVADLVNQAPGARPPTGSIPQFDPRADSPSIRRTQGVNPGRSAPVTRQALSGAAANSGSPAPPPQAGSTSGQTTPLRANFVNPGADPNRRIGMPPSGGPNGQNRGAYRPPSAAKRAPLSDVSNLQQTDGTGDAKKAKVDTGEGEALQPTSS